MIALGTYKNQDFHFEEYLFVYVDALCPSQQCFNHVGTISSLPLLNQYKKLYFICENIKSCISHVKI